MSICSLPWGNKHARLNGRLGGCRQTGRFGQRIGFVGFFPGKAFSVAPEVASRRGGAEDGALELQVVDDAAGGEREMRTDQFANLVVIDAAATLRVNMH